MPVRRLSEGEFSSIINELHQSGCYTSDELSLITTVLSEHSSVPSLEPYELPGFWHKGESRETPQQPGHKPSEVEPTQIQLDKEGLEYLFKILLGISQQREEEAGKLRGQGERPFLPQESQAMDSQRDKRIEEAHESRPPEPNTKERTQSPADDFAQQLHDKWTRGEPLSAKEKVQLKNWYALQDSAESKALGLTAAEKTSATLQTQIDTALTGLVEVTKRIQKIAAENKTLRGKTVNLLGTKGYS